MRYFFFLFLIFSSFYVQAQSTSNTTKTLLAQRWVDSVFGTLSEEEKIAQLMVVRLSSFDAKTRKAIFYDSLVNQLILKLCGIIILVIYSIDRLIILHHVHKK